MLGLESPKQYSQKGTEKDTRVSAGDIQSCKKKELPICAPSSQEYKLLLLRHAV